MAEINLIRDVLDNQLVDRDGRRMGRVDGIVAELREGTEAGRAVRLRDERPPR